MTIDDNGAVARIANLVDATGVENLEPGRSSPPEAVVECKPVLEFKTIGELAVEVDARPHPGFLARPVWPADAYGVIGAEAKLGKTWMVGDLIVSVASDGVWLEQFPVERPGVVVAFLGEGGPRKMLRRFRAIGAAKNVAVEDLPIHLSMRVPHLTNKEHIDEITRKVVELQPVLVVVDPLYLAARGAKGSDLYAMGEHLETVQHVTQSVGAALVVVHHFNQTGSGTGSGRLSGAGPAEWGRVLVSASAVAKHTDNKTQATTATIRLEFTGDEIPETTHHFCRKVWAEDPDKLDSRLHYLIGGVTQEQAQAADDPKAKVLRVVWESPFQLTKEEIVKAVGGRAQDLRQLITEMDGKELKSRLIHRPGRDGRTLKHWAFGPASEPGRQRTPEDMEVE